jgi:PAS domain S-box-containing protein
MEASLKKAHQELEVKIEERTAKLKTANEQLQQEINVRKQAEKELRKSEEKYHKLIDTANDAIFIAETETGIIIDANKKAEELLGVPVEEIIGMHQALLHEKDDRDYYRKLFADQAQRDKGVITGDIFVCHKNGNKIPIEISTSVTDIGGIKIMQGIFRNITERKQAEKEIKKTKDHLENIFKTSVDGILVTDSKGTITMVNDAIEKMLDYSKDELIEKHPRVLVPEGKEYEAEGREFIKQLHEEGTAMGRERIFSKKDGSVVTVEQSAALLKDDKGNHAGSVGIIRDITERKQAEKKFFEYQNKLKSLTSELTLTEERERRRFADYLHDHIGQKLFISKLKVEALKKSLYSTDNDKALDEIHEIIFQMIKDTRSLTSDLSPQVLYQLGLEAALECLTEQTSEQYGIMIDFEDDEQEKELEDDIKILLFQTVRELLLNVAKHARAQNAKVSVQRDNTHIKICVEDDGVGFNPSDRDVSKTANVGFGLFSIGERLDHLGGHFEIKSQPAYGTKATLMAPLKGKKEIQMG